MTGYKAARAEIKKLLQQEGKDYGAGSIRYNFSENRKIKRIYVTKAQQAGLAEGRRMGGGRKMSKTNGFIYVVPELDTGR